MNRTLCYLAVTVLLNSFVLAVLEDEDYTENDDYDDGGYNSTSTANSTLVFITSLSNSTRDPEKSVKFTCEVQNLNSNSSKVTFHWKKNHALFLSDNRIKIKTKNEKDNRWRSTLSIKKLEFFDQGFIECIASNGVDKIRSEATLVVNPESHMYGSTAANSLSFGGSDGENDDMTTFVPSAISNNAEQHTDLMSTLPHKTKTFPTSITYDVDSSGKVVDSDSVEQNVIYNGSEPFCQIYRGEVCKNFLANQYVFVQPPYTMEEIESKLFNAFVVILRSNDISQSCNKFAQPSICFSAFPLCLNHRDVNEFQKSHKEEFKLVTNETKKKFKNIRKRLTDKLRRICRDECILLENELCSKEYSIAKRHPVIGLIMELEVCENLPVEMDPSSSHCLSLGVGDFKGNKEEQCYYDKGKLYRGIQNVTASGETCIKWSHQFQLLPSEYPELAGHNYCRNPGDAESEPFCYVSHNKREVCGISRCVLVFGTYVAVILLIITLAISLTFSYCFCRRKKKIARNLQNDLPQASKNIYGNPGPSSPIELNTLLPPNNIPTNQRNHTHSKIGYQSLPQYTYKEVRFVKELGEGAFGKVYQGELKTKTGKVFVAVKSLKENASAKTQADFQREIELISELKHPNIICLLGVVTKQEPMCMLFEYMSEGDLHEFLISNSPENGKCLTHDQFLDIAIQIAQGMEYLSDNHYVHRDLAARNCLVSKDMEVKISDFGLSRDMYSCDYYRVQSKSLLPVRWMPPESILYGKFTTESDVWSYGVVLWEIYSYGLQPYYGYNNQEVINMIRSRKLLPCPDACPSYCYALMVECWAEQANRRPNFKEISDRLKVWKQSGCTNGAYYKSLPSSCQPTPQRHCLTGSKSSHASDSQTLCTAAENQVTSLTWESERHKPSSSRLHDSQSSLTSGRSSSLGNTTQSTNISLEGRKERRHKGSRNLDSLDRMEKVNPKNTVVSSSTSGDNFETKIKD
ncbi:tyrosine-protein kinase transmembrane receptor Ror-like isoform X2 [Rhynchophorus ferrugineus]|uniref:tyrosine-protein kinase transmembrane receptor Ror-like isoform X2 n=1 Tax=Rhynchophorus ferrugineus TaxID=354439 RepID=UPI003FCD1900